MNKLEKFFNTLGSSNSKLIKKYTTEELCFQIKEFIDFTPYICKNIYKLLISKNLDDRLNGAEILKSIMFQFKLITDFIVEFKDNKDEYLSSTGEEFEEKKLSVSEQKRLLKKIADLEHVETNIVNEIDFKADSKIVIKKQKIQDKPINNIVDFFENITNNLLNYEWNKRHGAFLAYCAIFDSETKGTIEIKIDSSIFLKIYEILISDKFNDFIEDKTTAPVRESAATLLSLIYNRIPKNNIIDQLIIFLQNDDWQIQYSGLLALKSLKKYIVNKIELCENLTKLLNAKDEDVKFLAAELLVDFYDYCNKKIVFEKCLENIKDNEEISVSKVSIITLLAKSEFMIEDTSILYNYFTSPISDVRKSVLKVAAKLNDESMTFLIGELILIDENEEICEEAINILNSRKNLNSNFVSHFLHILSTSLYEPYDKNLFVSYDDSFFTKSGIKSVGINTILNNRVRLFKIICKLGEPEKIDNNFNTSIGEIFKMLYNKFKMMSVEENTKKSKIFTIESVCIETLHKKYIDLRYAPLKELRSKYNDISYKSIHLFGDTIFRDSLRYLAVYNLPKLDEHTLNYFVNETCLNFLEFVSKTIIDFYDIINISLEDFLMKSYNFVIIGNLNFITFLKIFGLRIFSTKFYEFILKNEEKLRFFEKTILFYEKNYDKMKFLYEESYEKKSIPILKGFIQKIAFLEDFIEKFFNNLDFILLEQLIEFIDHSYYPLFVKPLLKQISLPENQEIAAKLFSFIIPKLNFRMNCYVSKHWKNKIIEHKKDLESLLDSSKIADYTIKCPTIAVLRKYQLDGIKWINFLYKFGLNGILADDMGLGKTVQVLTFLCSEIYNTKRKVLIICPSSLTGHWEAEVLKFFPSFRPFCYKKNKNSVFDFLITSYDSFRNDFHHFADEDWFYVIFDEGHILRNSNTLLYQRIKKIKCSRRLILTGTPIHNSVEDLVSLFNLLMPNYLGSIKDIPYMNSKMSDSEIHEIHNQLEILNKKILPFILRRLKVDVLTDLPPKIIRDINVEMGPEQSSIYNRIAEEGQNILDNLNYKTVQSKAEGLNRTRNLLNASSHISYFKTSIEKSCKVKALEDLIMLCGGEDMRNKILIFFQYKTTIDYVINDFTKKFNLKFLRLDGTVPASKRSKIAADFNTGNIPILFLTTHIGGLGLNLTGADTVIFYEHDWNPFNDLQAMDRAHRIGQKNTVNVFRLIAKDTIEQKVMDLQSFKLFIASSVVSQQNADIETMDTKDLLERFSK